MQAYQRIEFEQGVHAPYGIEMRSLYRSADTPILDFSNDGCSSIGVRYGTLWSGSSNTWRQTVCYTKQTTK
jgi:hypothetical protein